MRWGLLGVGISGADDFPTDAWNARATRWHSVVVLDANVTTFVQLLFDAIR